MGTSYHDFASMVQWLAKLAADSSGGFESWPRSCLSTYVAVHPLFRADDKWVSRENWESFMR